MSENENESENKSENENENESESESENENTGTHRCPRCCRQLLLPSLLRSPLPSPSPPPPAFLLLPLLVDFCPSHHCRHHRPPSPSPPFLPLPLLVVDCCILYLPMPKSTANFLAIKR